MNMTELFLTILNMSISAGWIVLAVVVLRLLLKKAPKWIAVLLWGIVAIRLLCPVTVESVMSLIPSAETVSPDIMQDRAPEIHTGVSIINSAVNPIIEETSTPDPMTSINPLQIWIPVMGAVWIAGMGAMVLYTAFSYWRVKKMIGTAVRLRDNIYQSETVVSPFVLGLVKPKIYLPFAIGEQDVPHVLAHEQAHIRRRDYLWKPLGFLLLTVHWFNPLLWLGYILLCRDIELACDEKVVKGLDREERADYSQALLSCSVNRRVIAACPLAFGEVSVKNRVKSVLNYKKPAFWIILVAVIALIITAVCFLTNPKTEIDEELSMFIDGQICDHNYSPDHTDDHFIAVHHKVLGVEKSGKETTVYLWALYHEYSYHGGQIQLESGSHIPTAITVEKTGTHGHYKLVEYWTPRDGAYYAQDIKEKFPRRLQGDALDPQKFIAEQEAFCDKAAREYYASQQSRPSKTEPVVRMVPPAGVQQLMTKYPEYFGLEHTKGLEVYIWQTEQGDYACGLLSGRNRNYTKEEIWQLRDHPASLEEMQVIVLSYMPDVSRSEVAVIEVRITDAGYDYVFDNQEMIDEMFWSNFPVLVAFGYYVPIIDSATFDIDGDGKEESCTLGYGPTSGLFTVTLRVQENGENEYFNTYMLDHGDLSFVKTDSGWKLKLIPSLGDLEVVYYSFSVRDGNIVLTRNGEEAFYWGEQGLHSPWSGIQMDENGNILSATSYPEYVTVYEETPTDQVEEAFDKGEFVIRKTHDQDIDGSWVCNGYSYLFRLEVTGKLHASEKNSTYIILANRKDITFDQAWKASGLSSNLNDYFTPDDAVIVGIKLF